MDCAKFCRCCKLLHILRFFSGFYENLILACAGVSSRLSDGLRAQKEHGGLCGDSPGDGFCRFGGIPGRKGPEEVPKNSKPDFGVLGATSEIQTSVRAHEQKNLAKNGARPGSGFGDFGGSRARKSNKNM